MERKKLILAQKSIVRSLATVLFFLFSFIQTANSTHLMGGEITWECQPSGMFIIHMKLYQDCNGNQILGGNETIQLFNHSSISTITMNYITETDISPSCGAGGPNINCTDGGAGAVKEFLYASDPIMLTGIPPAQGWAFTWDSFARNDAIDNLQNPGSSGMTIRAIMYPFNGQSNFPCFDSSPDFAEIATAMVCSGGAYTYNHNASDRDLDSIAYKWGQPLDYFDAGYGPGFNPPTYPTIVPFQSPYSLNSPLPGSPTLNVSTGEIDFNASVQGEFVTCVKIESWRCGQLISEVFREIQLVITGCTANDAPVVSITDLAGNPISYADTVFVGDVVSFILTGVDVGQDVTLSSSSTQYGTNYANPNSGCVNPPCAVLGPPPVSGSMTETDSVTVQFNWETDCNHISYNDACATASNTYTFVFNIQDDNCPSAGKSVATIAITVIAKPTIDPPELHCAAVNPVNGDVTLNWAIPLDTAATFDSYHVYYSTDLNGPYTVVDSIFTYTQTSYTHIGANADQQSVYYYMRSRSGCLGAVFTTQSDTLQTIDVNSTFNIADGTITVSWNQLHTPLLVSSDTWYKIYKEFPIGAWNLYDSTQATSYIDTTSNCNDSVTYWIQIDDDLTCTSLSSFGGIGYSNSPPGADFSFSGLCERDTTFFTDISTGIVSTWSWRFGDGSIDSVQNPNHIYQFAGSYSVTLVISSGIGCIDSVTKTITVNGTPIPDAGPNDSICVFDTTQLAGVGGWVNTAWGTSMSLSDTTILTPNAYPTTTTNYIFYATDANGCKGTDTVEIVVWGLPNPILADIAQFCISDSVQIVAGGGDTYIWSPITDLSNPNIPNPYAQPTDTAQYFVTITDGNGCSNNDSIVIYINPLPIVDAGLDRQICINDTTELVAIGGVNYAWAPTDSLSQADSSNTFAWPTDTTMYYVQVTDSNGCVNVDSVLITVNPLPVITTGLDRQICIGDTTELIATGGDLYAWLPTDSLSNLANDSTFAWPTDTTNYIIEITDSNSCVNYDSILVTVNPLPVVDAGLDVQICIGDTTELIATGGVNYVWSPTDSLSTPNNDSTFSWPTDTTKYIVQITDSNGCVAWDSVTVIV
ncbi:MAG: PKD domain-containing protein, partial [Flavobacteriales bacterium]|nr:PKD domain-containing protein [Flavobacteriales bacterium]